MKNMDFKLNYKLNLLNLKKRTSSIIYEYKTTPNGNIISDGKYCYFSELKEFYKVSLTNNELKKVEFPSMNTSHMILINNSIYFADIGNYSYTFYEIDKNTLVLQQIGKYSGTINPLLINEGNKLYFICRDQSENQTKIKDTHTIYVIDLQTKEKDLIKENIIVLSVNNDILYYKENGKVLKKHLTEDGLE